MILGLPPASSSCVYLVAGLLVMPNFTLRRCYNVERSHHGYRLKGRTPGQALKEALGVKEIPPVVPNDEVNEPLQTAA